MKKGADLKEADQREERARHCEEQQGMLCIRKRDEAISKHCVYQSNAGDCFVAPPALAPLLLAMTGYPGFIEWATLWRCSSRNGAT
ncbi:hypothetical protein [Chitinophaga sp. YIM B06452]|uniref:hypothetical protein n=1 Tax=Chitinophaga sp. YIM B06452 TaxID=3082158 RepID=UPI0031FF32BD